jgi:hypothetical protein
MSTQSLATKIAQIAGLITGVEQDGMNKHLNYRYTRPETVYRTVKPLLAERQVALLPSITAVHRHDTGEKTQKGSSKVLTTVEITYTLCDGESGETLTMTWFGEGEDWGDKGVAKATTVAMRTFLIHLFQIPAGEDDVDPDAGPAARPTNGKRHEMTSDDAKQRFFARWGKTVGGTDWAAVVAYMGYEGDLAHEPGSVSDWAVVASDVQAKSEAA